METYKTNTENSSQKELCKECQHCLETLELVLDKEASEEDKAYVKLHLETCTHCWDCYEVDKTLREKLKEKISKKCPNELLKCIKDKISA